MNRSDLELEVMLATENLEQSKTTTQQGITISTITREIQSKDKTFVSIDYPDLDVDEENSFKDVQQLLEDQLMQFLPSATGTVCIVGLGNQWMTADALGPRVIQKLQQQYNFLQSESVFLLQPGVELQSGMETSRYIRAIVKEMEPSCLIAIDSLRASTESRLCRFLQMTDAGIRPGSGLVQGKKEISKEVLGVPVIALGVPTVVSTLDVAHYQLEYAMQHLMNRLDTQASKNPLASVAYWQAEDKDLSELDSLFGQFVKLQKEERRQFFYENAGHTDKIVTLTNIHEWIERWSDTLCATFVNVLTKGSTA